MQIVFQYLIGFVLYSFSAIYPKNSRIWVFGAWGGKKYADNPRYLFEYTSRNHPEVTCVWLSTNSDIIEMLRRMGNKAYHPMSLRGILYSCKAKVGVVSHGMVDINRYACAGLKVVQTWHGIPMKPILLSDPKQQTKRRRKILLFLSLFFPFLKKDLVFDDHLIICSSSKFVTEVLKKVFGNNAPILETGFPRLDGLSTPLTEDFVYQQICQLKKEGVKVGIYIPTYRRKGEFNIVEYFLENIDNIGRHMAENGSQLYIRFHPFDFQNIPEDLKYSNINFLQDKDILWDFYKVLSCFDFLITDYSSICFDYALLNKPIIFLTPDRDSYIESNGYFVYDYINTNLPVYNTWNNLMEDFEHISKNRGKELLDFSKAIHTHRDGNSSKRLFTEVKNKINLK
jgi:CDP-glycerol glycerophosphotransferase (TagB/SpsB family)